MGVIWKKTNILMMFGKPMKNGLVFIINKQNVVVIMMLLELPVTMYHIIITCVEKQHANVVITRG